MKYLKNPIQKAEKKQAKKTHTQISKKKQTKRKNARIQNTMRLQNMHANTHDKTKTYD